MKPLPECSCIITGITLSVCRDYENGELALGKIGDGLRVVVTQVSTEGLKTEAQMAFFGESVGK